MEIEAPIKRHKSRALNRPKDWKRNHRPEDGVGVAQMKEGAQRTREHNQDHSDNQAADEIGRQ